MNITGLSGANSFQTVLFWTNNQVSGLLFVGGITVLFAVMLIQLMRNDEPFANALATSSWSMFVISTFFFYAQLIPALVPLVLLILAIVSVFLMYGQRSSY